MDVDKYKTACTIIVSKSVAAELFFLSFFLSPYIYWIERVQKVYNMAHTYLNSFNGADRVDGVNKFV